MEQRGLLRLTGLGWGVALPVLFLCTLGLVTIHAEDGQATRHSDAHTVVESRFEAFARWAGPHTLKQLAFLVTGVALLLLTLAVGYQRIGRWSYVIYAGVLCMLGMLALDRVFDVPLVPVKRATRRWIEFGGVGVQPSEFMKLALVLVLARYLRYRESYRRWSGLLTPFALTLAPMLLILLQPDLGTLLMLLPVLFAMLFVAGARVRHLAVIIGLGLVLMPLFYIYGMHDYQRKRIDVVIRQGVADERWHMNEGYQLRQSKIALGLGGIVGEGYGQGAFIEHDLLPDEHNDFIFAMIGNQWGFFGCLMVLLAYAALVLVGVEVTVSTNDPFGRLLSIGVIVMVVAQALLNIGMTIGVTPITGMTLPFISYGGSSLWTNFIAIGLMLSVAQRRPLLIMHPPFEHTDD